MTTMLTILQREVLYSEAAAYALAIHETYNERNWVEASEFLAGFDAVAQVAQGLDVPMLRIKIMQDGLSVPRQAINQYRLSALADAKADR